ncbi:hypothetical protein MMC34_006702 [Xylographa carneopallida]|nr:hypothetical protein [Xylographa carneopallida]
MLHDCSLPRPRVGVALSVILFVFLTLLGLQSLRKPLEIISYHAVSVSHLPQDYQQPQDEPRYCDERFGLQYLQSFGNTSVDYCDAESLSWLTCFHSQTAENGRVDSFCIGGPASFDSRGKTFQLNCQFTQLSSEDSKGGIPKFEHFPSYWYETGPRSIFNNYVKTDDAGGSLLVPSKSSPNFSILVKREEKVTNLWHSLMEISALSMTLDVLRATQDQATGMAFLTAEDVHQTQVVILDSHPDGPYYDLWTLFASKPVIRIDQLPTTEVVDVNTLIVPLPGASNPLWQGDWKSHSCDHSELLRVFSERVLKFYSVDMEPTNLDSPLVLTFIDRKEKRRLINKDLYIENLRAKFPAIDIQMVDFAALSFVEQIRIARRTDILVGVHGAGLTHELFQRPGSAVVEVIPHSLAHKGFRNLAKLLGHGYFSSHADDRPTTTAKDAWQTDDVSIEEDRFMNLLEVAVKSMYNRGLLNSDVVR